MIATAGRPDLLAGTLASLAACRRPANYSETIVIENGARLGVESVVRDSEPMLRARYLHVVMQNKSVALNAALDGLPDCLIHFVDDDARVAPDTLRAYAEAAAGLEGNVFFGGPVGIDYTEAPPPWLIDYLPESARGWQPKDATQIPLTWSFLGINWAAFSADLKRIGGFSEHVGPGSPSGAPGQESEAQTRLMLAGCARRYVPAAMAWHFVPAERCSPEWAIERFRKQGISLAATLWHRGRFHSLALRSLAFARRLPRLAILLARPGAPYEFRRRYIRAYWEGFRHGVRVFRERGTAGDARNPIAAPARTE